MDSIVIPDFRAGLSFPGVVSAVHACGLPCVSRIPRVSSRSSSTTPAVSLQRSRSIDFRMPGSIHVAANGTTNSVPLQDVVYTVGDFMTNKDNLHVVRTTTTVDEALECLVYKRVTGFPVIDDDWRLVGVVSDYDLLALDSISGGGQNDINIFPVVNSTWKAFNELQRLLSKTNGKVVGDLMTPAPLVVRENTNLEDAARLLLQTKYRRLPVVDGEGRLIGIITRGDVIKAALQIKQDAEKWTKMP